MIPRKKRILIMIISIILVVLMLLVAFALIYLNTDMFKSNKTLFMKYLGQNSENVKQMYSKIMQENDYEKALSQNKYTINTQINVNNTENIGTTQENTNNIINQLKVIAEGQVDSQNQYNYQKLNLYKGEESLLELEYVQDANTYGIHFSDLFQQFLLADNSNLQELFMNLGYTEQEALKMPNQIDVNQYSLKNIEFTGEEEDRLLNTYIGIIEKNIENQEFSKEKDQTIQINEKNVQVNGYSVTLTKEQLNNMYLEILNQLKADEIILGKLDLIQEALNEIKEIIPNDSGVIEEKNLKELFIENIDETITRNQSKQYWTRCSKNNCL